MGVHWGPHKYKSCGSATRSYRSSVAFPDFLHFVHYMLTWLQNSSLYGILWQWLDFPSWYVFKLSSDSPCSLVRFVYGVREIAPYIFYQRQVNPTANDSQPTTNATSALYQNIFGATSTTVFAATTVANNVTSMITPAVKRAGTPANY